MSAGYYNSAVPIEEKDDGFLTNGFSSFIGSEMSFNLDVSKNVLVWIYYLNSLYKLNNHFVELCDYGYYSFQNLNSSVFANTQTPQNSLQESGAFISSAVQNPPLPVQAPVQTTVDGFSYSTTSSYSTSHLPLQPPPMPPFTKSDYNNPSFDMIFSSNTSASATYSEYMQFFYFTKVLLFIFSPMFFNLLTRYRVIWKKN